MHTGEDQSCVISGQSGSGKTESSKYIFRHLLALSRGAVPNLLRDYDVMDFTMNTLLEAFGNAQTVRNGNSSRFGKHMEVCAASSCAVVILKGVWLGV